MNEFDLFLDLHEAQLGKSSPEEILFTANLQEFSQRVGYVVALQNGGQLSVGEAVQAVDSLWNQLSDEYGSITPDQGNSQTGGNAA
ncbi:MAG: hypothetical protein AAGF24_15180 [Cyanobacteria bacterium P01_H01_bin.121]